jgi:spermidine synthase
MEWQCDTEQFYDWSGYFTLDIVKSKYQTIVFEHNPTTKDTAFSLDGIVQQTSSFRPQYHDVFVHYSARYLGSVKRVLWIGGGDSMLLHELMKYPSLELAVGLELDQQGR